VNLIRSERFSKDAETEVLAMVRYRAKPAGARALLNEDGSLGLRFTEPQRAVSPGQLVALFDPNDEEVLGAATISEAL